MDVIVGHLAGFCGGVINSIRKSEEILNDYGSVYCLGELVHNRHAVYKLEEKGLKIIDSLNDVNSGDKVIIRAHGISKDVYDIAIDKGIELIDLTCPKVLKVHEEALKLKSDGYFIILIAKKVHPETIGTISFCGEDSAILESMDEVESVVNVVEESDRNKVAVIAQTTFSVELFNKLVDELKKNLKDYDFFVNNTICNATELRQKETIELANKVEAMVIIGGKNSSNTKNLYELAIKNCSNCFIIEEVSELNCDLSNFPSVGVMAGASTPQDIIDEVVLYLKRL